MSGHGIRRNHQYPWISNITFNDFHFHLASFLTSHELQRLAGVNHLWHDKIRYDIQRFLIADAPFAWAVTFSDFCRLGQSALAGFFWNGEDICGTVDQLSAVSSSDEEEEDPQLEYEFVSLIDKHFVGDKSGEGEEFIGPPVEEDEEREDNEDCGSLLSDTISGSESIDDEVLYADTLQKFDFIKGTCRNLQFDDAFFHPKNHEYRSQLLSSLSNPTRQLCLYLRNTSISQFHALSVRPYRLCLVRSDFIQLTADQLPLLSGIPNLQLHGNCALTNLDGLTEVTILELSYFTQLEYIASDPISSLREVKIAYCQSLTSLSGLSAVRNAYLEELPELGSLEGLSACEDITLITCPLITSISELPLAAVVKIENCYSLAFPPGLELPLIKKIQLPDFGEEGPPPPRLPNATEVSCFLPFHEIQFETFLPRSMRSLTLIGREPEFVSKPLVSFSYFQRLRELALVSVDFLSDLKVLRSLPQPLKRIVIQSCNDLLSLEGLEGVRDVVLFDLPNVASLEGLSPALDQLTIENCEISAFESIQSVNYLTIDGQYSLELSSDSLQHLGRIVKKMLYLQCCSSLTDLTGLETIPMLKLDDCHWIESFASLKNEKIMIDKATSIRYDDKLDVLNDSPHYLREEYFDHIVYLRRDHLSTASD